MEVFQTTKMINNLDVILYKTKNHMYIKTCTMPIVVV